MIRAVLTNIPDWKVFVQALVTLAVPIMVTYVFNWFRKAEEE
ncbi:MAG: hypothetical protein ACQEXQ_17515 [Bacillota bacterium]